MEMGTICADQPCQRSSLLLRFVRLAHEHNWMFIF
jgi:hypothetical protein